MKISRIFLVLVAFCVSTLSAQSYSRILTLVNPRSYGDDVKMIQASLKELGFVEVGEIDGWFGPKTLEATKNFQMLFGFNVDGIINIDVYNAITNKVKDIRLEKYYEYIRSINVFRNTPLKMHEIDYSGHSTEGGIIEIYTAGDKKVYGILRLYGEIKQASFTVYKLPDASYVMFIKEIQYLIPFEFKGSKEVYSTFFYYNGKEYLIRNGSIMESDRKNIEILNVITSYL